MNARALAACTLIALAAAPDGIASDTDWKASAMVDYEKGDYGTGSEITSVYIPFTLKRYWDAWEGSVTVPYVSQTSNGQVTNIGGRLLRIKGSSKVTVSTVTMTNSGLGDIVARAGYALLEEGPQPFDLTAEARVKIPTASSSEGLGTGEFDEGADLQFGKAVGPAWRVLANIYYTFIGSPPGTPLNNELFYDAGISYSFRKETTMTVLYEASNALVPGTAAPRDLRGTLEQKLNQTSRIFCGLLVGLSDGSADYGIQFGGSRRF